jgi:uncharacterized membrane protein
MTIGHSTDPDAGYTNVSHPERWFSVIAGAALAAYGLTRRTIPGWLSAAAGGVLIWRGATGHCFVYDSVGFSTAKEPPGDHVSVPYGRGVRVEKSVMVNAPPKRLFEFWRNFENLPQFMSHLQSVKVIDAKHSHWKTKGPAGTDVEWDAEVINEVPNQLIGWRSVDGSEVNHAGSVHFNETGRGTEVRVILRYDPPAGKLGAAIARIFGEDAGNQVEEDLRLFKRLIEAAA